MTTTNPALNGWSDLDTKRPPAGPNFVMQTFYGLTSNTLSICLESAPGVFAWLPVNTGSASGGGSQQTDWAVNASTGNDNAAGTSAAPLATLAAFRQRLLANPLSQDLGIVTLAIVGSTNTDDPLQEQGITPLGGTQVNVVGTPVPILSNQVITAVTTKNSASGVNVPMSITVAGLPLSWTASGILEVLCVITGPASPRVGAYFVAVKDLGGKAARISDAELDVASSFPFSLFGSVFAAPHVNDTFTAMSLPIVDRIIPDPVQSTPLNADGATIRWLHQQLFVDSQSNPLLTTGATVAYLGCNLAAPISQNEAYYTCSFRESFSAFAGMQLLMVGGAALSGSSVSIFGAAAVEVENADLPSAASARRKQHGRGDRKLRRRRDFRLPRVRLQRPSAVVL